MPEPIINNEPVTVPAATYSLFYVSDFRAFRPTLADAHAMTAEFRPYEPGAEEYGPGLRTLAIPDIWAEAATDPEAADVLTRLMAYLDRKAREQGVI